MFMKIVILCIGVFINVGTSQDYPRIHDEEKSTIEPLRMLRGARDRQVTIPSTIIALFATLPSTRDLVENDDASQIGYEDTVCKVMIEQEGNHPTRHARFEMHDFISNFPAVAVLQGAPFCRNVAIFGIMAGFPENLALFTLENGDKETVVDSVASIIEHRAPRLRLFLKINQAVEVPSDSDTNTQTFQNSTGTLLSPDARGILAAALAEDLNLPTTFVKITHVAQNGESILFRTKGMWNQEEVARYMYLWIKILSAPQSRIREVVNASEQSIFAVDPIAVKTGTFTQTGDDFTSAEVRKSSTRDYVTSIRRESSWQLILLVMGFTFAVLAAIVSIITCVRWQGLHQTKHQTAAKKRQRTLSRDDSTTYDGADDLKFGHDSRPAPTSTQTSGYESSSPTPRKSPQRLRPIA